MLVDPCPLRAKAEMIWSNYLCGQELLPEGKIRILSFAFPQDLGLFD